MKYFHMNGLIDKEMVDRFIDFYNQHSEQESTIVLNTSGGGYFQAEIIVKMINEMSNVLLHVQGAYSAGFMILFYAKCNKELSKTCRGMWHYGKWEVAMSDKNKPYYHEDVCIVSNMPSHVKEVEKIAKKTMNKVEYAKFKRDNDVYFNTTRMNQIFVSKNKHSSCIYTPIDSRI